MRKQQSQTGPSPPQTPTAAKIGTKAARPLSRPAVQAAARTDAQRLPPVVEVSRACQDGSDRKRGEQ